MTETLTILRTTPTPQGAPRFATKQWTYRAALGDWTKISYEAGATFTAEERPIANVRDLAAALDGIRRDPTAFVVRGELLPDAREALAHNPQHRFRRAKKVGKKGQAPTLAERAIRQVMIDVDGYPLKESDDLATDPETAIERAIRDLLPECFQDALCFWQLSASAGFVPGILKVHLWFWLAAPIANEDLKLYLQVHAPTVDRAPFNAAQPHYVADPIIVGGHDPLPRRTGWIKGLDEEVTLPALDLAQLRDAVRQKRERAATGAGLDASAARTMAGALALLGDGEGYEGWHAPLRRATWLYAFATSPRNRDDEAVKTECRKAIRAAADREAGRHAAADLDRFGSDAYLDNLIEGAFVRVAADKAETPQGTAPQHEAPAHTRDEAREAVRDRIWRFMLDAAKWHAAPKGAKPPQLGLAVDVGVGKSRAAREAVVAWIEAAKSAGQPHRVLWLVPTVKGGGLGPEAEAHFRALGVSVAVHRGRERMDPEKPGEAMCLDLEAVKLATIAGEAPEQAVCGSDKPGAPACPFRSGEGVCGYYRQATAVAAADVVIAAHEGAFHLPPGAKKRLGLVVFDESWWQDGLRLDRGIFVEGMAGSVRAYPVLGKGRRGQEKPRDDEATQDLIEWRARLERALADAPLGYLRRETLLKAGLSVADCGEARKHEYARKREDLMRPGMSAEARRKAAEEAGVNAMIPRFAAMWTIAADLLAGDAEATGHAEVMMRPDRDGTPRLALCLNTVAEMAQAVAEAPTLLLDATMPAELVRAYLPRLEAAEPVRVKTPFMEVRQIRGGWGKTTILPGGRKITLDDDGKPANLTPLLGELRDFVLGETRGERALVVTYMDAENAFAGLPGVEVAHFNDVAGKDVWGPGEDREGVRHLFVIGQPSPRSDQVRAMAAALTGEPVQVAESHRETRGVRMADGTGSAVEVRTYANPAAEAVSAAITTAEVVQAIGRARGVNREAANPVRVWIMASVVTPLVVDELLDWRDLAPSAAERMAARGIVLGNSADASRAFPDLFPNPEAARKAYQRAGVGKAEVRDILLRRLLLGDCPGLPPLRFAYRPKGQGQQTRHGWARPDMDPEEVWRWLEGHLGELAAFTPDEPPSPPPDPPRRAPEMPMGAGGGPRPQGGEATGSPAAPSAFSVAVLPPIAVPARERSALAMFTPCDVLTVRSASPPRLILRDSAGLIRLGGVPPPAAAATDDWGRLFEKGSKSPFALVGGRADGSPAAQGPPLPVPRGPTIGAASHAP